MCIRDSDGRFNPTTGVGRVEAHKGHYADALRKGTTVDALLSNPFGGLAPATLAHLFQLDDVAPRRKRGSACGNPERDGESMCDGTDHRSTMAGYGGEGLQSGLPVGRGDG